MTFRLERVVAVVTGGAAGVGSFISEALVGRGSRVVIGDVDDEAGNDESVVINRAECLL